MYTYTRFLLAFKSSYASYASKPRRRTYSLRDQTFSGMKLERELEVTFGECEKSEQLEKGVENKKVGRTKKDEKRQGVGKGTSCEL